MTKVDLHIHSYYSDGVYSPKEIIHLAKAAGLKVIAITDHDSVGGLAEAEKEAVKEEVSLIPAIEFSCVYKGKDVHVIGYLIDYCNPSLVEHLKRFQGVRMNRLKEMVEKLKSIGIDINLSEVVNNAKASSVGRPHIAKALVEKGHAANIKDAFYRYLQAGAIAFVAKTKVSPIEIIQIIQEAGGKAIWAHPSKNDFYPMFRLLVENGLNGIEAYYPQCDITWRKELLSVIDEYKLMVTGGSDWHGLELDLQLGDFFLEAEKITSLINLYNESPNNKGKKVTL